MKSLRSLHGGVVFLLTGLAALTAPATYAGEFADRLTWDDEPALRASPAALEGKPMPALSLSEWINGEVTPADLKGKVVVVDIYATWCGPCMSAIPHNNELLAKYKNRGLVVIGVCASGCGQNEFAANAKEHGIQYPAALDVQDVSGKNWQANYYPTYALVDRKGIVRVIGLQPQNVEEAVKKLLAEPASRPARKRTLQLSRFHCGYYILAPFIALVKLQPSSARDHHGAKFIYRMDGPHF